MYMKFLPHSWHSFLVLVCRLVCRGARLKNKPFPYILITHIFFTLVGVAAYWLLLLLYLKLPYISILYSSGAVIPISRLIPFASYTLSTCFCFSVQLILDLVLFSDAVIPTSRLVLLTSLALSTRNSLLLLFCATYTFVQSTVRVKVSRLV